MTCTVKPSQLYRERPFINEAEWRVVDFRLPLTPAEFWVSATPARYGRPYNDILQGDPGAPRIIVERRIVVNTGTIDSVWE